MGDLLQPWHLIVLAVVAFLVFGAKRLPEIGRSLGSGMREFKDSVTGNSASEQSALPAPEPPRAQAQPQPPVAQPAQPPPAPVEPQQHG